MPRTSRDYESGVPTFDLFFEPRFAFIGRLLPRPQVIGVTCREFSKVFPTQVDWNAASGSIRQTDKCIGVSTIPSFKILGVPPWKPERRAAWIHEIERRSIVKIIPIHLNSQPNLTQIVHAMRPASALLRSAKRGKQHRREDCNDRDHHQELDQSECKPRRIPARVILEQRGHLDVGHGTESFHLRRPLKPSCRFGRTSLRLRKFQRRRPLRRPSPLMEESLIESLRPCELARRQIHPDHRT